MIQNYLKKPKNMEIQSQKVEFRQLLHMLEIPILQKLRSVEQKESASYVDNQLLSMIKKEILI